MRNNREFKPDRKRKRKGRRYNFIKNEYRNG